ncbi:hypothetical protein J2Z31_005946 [Sinorhizobium kostiense]|uniref:Antibiotic biosynthesis monooxygenase n=1 Tax=Sinorhizobium kostiense TaxID=76747 RepID=A0ABS4RAQ0_9HYPH|nr:hypothetical protein [Sinorhizobium kostiense]
MPFPRVIKVRPSEYIEPHDPGWATLVCAGKATPRNRCVGPEARDEVDPCKTVLIEFYEDAAFAAHTQVWRQFLA